MKNEKTETKKTETGNETGTVTVTETIIGTAELSDIISERIGRNIEPKRIRSIFRNDPEFNGFDDGKYTKYKFRYPSETVDKIIDRFIRIEAERTERKNRSEKRQTEKRNRKTTVLELTDNGTVKTETVEPTEAETETK